MIKNTKNLLIVSGLFLLFCFIFLFIFFNKISTNSLVEQVEHRQQMSVRAGANAIGALLNMLGKSAVTLANNPNQKNLDSFTKMWADAGVSGLLVTDKEGVVVKNSNPQGIKDIGADMSDRDYYRWASKSEDGAYSVFPPVIAKLGLAKGKYVVPVASGIFLQQKFEGVLAIAVPLFELTDRYIQDLKVLESSKVYLITRQGEIVYSDSQELTGKNIRSFFEKDFLGRDKILEILLKELDKKDESKLRLAFPNKNGKLEPYLISAAPIYVSDQLWKIVVATPENDLLAFTYRNLNMLAVAIFITVVLFLGVSFRFVKDVGYFEAITDEHRIHSVKS